MTLPPILVLDLEATSEDRETAGIVDLAALWLDESMAGIHSLSFDERCRPRPHCEIQDEALKVNGCNWLRDKTVMTETEAICRLAAWLDGRKAILAGCNPGYDWHVLKKGWQAAMDDHESEWDLITPWPFGFRTIDVHSAAVIDAIQAGAADQISAEGLKSRLICNAFEVPEESKPHRAMAGASWECAVLRKVMGLPV